MEKYLGIDLGTSSVKLAVMNSKNELIYVKSGKYRIYTKGLNSEQDPNEWWSVIAKLIVEIPKNLKNDIQAISFSGQMHGMVTVDQNGRTLRKAILWNDTRTFQEVAYLNNDFGKKALSDETSNIALDGFTAPKILWLKNHEFSIFKQVYKYLLPKDWLIYKLTHKYATDVSDAAGSLCFNVKQRQWSKKVLTELGVSIEQMPQVFPSSGVVGFINIDVANYLGLNHEVKIIAGGADNPVGAISCGVVKNGDALISLGTSGVVYVPVDQDLVSPNNELHFFNSCTGNFYHMGVTLAAGGSLQWYMDQIAKDLDLKKIDEKFVANFKKTSLAFLPYLSGERTPINDPLATGAFLGIRREHDNLDFVSSIMEGVVFSIKNIFDIVESLKAKINRISLIGGGSKSKFWAMLLATILKKEIYISTKKNEGPVYGACMLAKAGYLKQDVKKILNDSRSNVLVIKPLSDDFAKYLLEKFKIWNQIYLKTKIIQHELMNLTSAKK